MIEKTCCVTGHRDIPQKEMNHVRAALRREIDCAVADGYTCFTVRIGKELKELSV